MLGFIGKNEDLRVVSDGFVVGFVVVLLVVDENQVMLGGSG